MFGEWQTKRNLLSPLMLLLASLLVGLLTGSVSAQGCVPYAGICKNTSMCCNSPVAVACLPDARNNTSCLSAFDILNLSPRLTGLSLLLPPLPGNSTAVVKEVVQVNGNTVYNSTEAVLANGTAVPATPTASGLQPSTAAGYSPSAGGSTPTAYAYPSAPSPPPSNSTMG